MQLHLAYARDNGHMRQNWSVAKLLLDLLHHGVDALTFEDIGEIVIDWKEQVSSLFTSCYTIKFDQRLPEPLAKLL